MKGPFLLMFILLFLPLGMGWARHIPQTDPQLLEHPSEQVLKKLQAVVGKKEKIQLYLSSDQQRVAAYYPSKNLIVLEERAFEICMELGVEKGTSALAFILGHELVHYYTQHPFPESMEKGFLSTAWSQDFIEEELEADVQGSLIAYLAGYKDLAKAVPEVLTALAADPVYQSSMNDLSYPPIEVRKKSYARARTRFEELSQMYEVAQYFSALGKYSYANSLLMKIKDPLGIGQLHYQIGVNALLEIMQDWQGPGSQFRFPVELSEARLDRPSKGSKKIDALFKTPIFHLGFCTRNFDAEGLPIDLAMATAQLIRAKMYANQGDERTARLYFYKVQEKLTEAEKWAHEPDQQAQVIILKGLLKTFYPRFFTGMTQAEDIFKEAQAVARSSYWQEMAAHNIRNLQSTDSIPRIQHNIRPIEQLEGQNLVDFSYFDYQDQADFRRIYQSTSIDVMRYEHLDVREYSQSTLWVFNKKSTCYLIHKTDHPDIQSRAGISVGMHKDPLLLAYGSPSQQLAMLGGHYLYVYPKESLVFLLDQEAYIVEWASYYFPD